jgi:hypothetical protein
MPFPQNQRAPGLPSAVFEDRRYIRICVSFINLFIILAHQLFLFLAHYVLGHNEFFSIASRMGASPELLADHRAPTNSIGAALDPLA